MHLGFFVAREEDHEGKGKERNDGKIDEWMDVVVPDLPAGDYMLVCPYLTLYTTSESTLLAHVFRMRSDQQQYIVSGDRLERTLEKTIVEHLIFHIIIITTTNNSQSDPFSSKREYGWNGVRPPPRLEEIPCALQYPVDDNLFAV